MWRKWDVPGKSGYFMNLKDTYLKDGVEVVLTKAQLEYRDFFQKSMREKWEDVMSKTVTNESTGQTRTLAEMYGFPKELPDDFMPRVPATLGELKGRESIMESGFGFGTTAKLIGQKYLAKFFDSAYYGDLTKGGLTVKYFGHTDSRVVEEENHTLNAEAAFAGFMSSLIRKKHLDDVLSLYEGTKNALLMERSPMGGPKFSNLAKLLDDQIYTRILNRQKEAKVVSKLGPITLGENLASKLGVKAGSYDIDQDQLIRLVRSAVSHSVMGFRFVGPVFNFAFISIVNASQGFKAVLKPIFGVADFEPSFKDVALGLTDVKDFWAASLTGKPSTKIWNLAKKSGWMPDNYSQALGAENLLSSSSSTDFNNMAFMFNNFVESYGALWHLSTLLRAYKYEKDGKMVSLYDGFNEQGEWIGGVRGKVEVTPGVFKDLAEPDELEWKNLKRNYERLHGSYRQEEKVAIESSVWGSFIVQFKKYFFQYLKVLYGSPYKDISMGKYVLDKDISRPDGVPVWKWEEELLEGRFRALVGASMAGLKYATMSKDEIDKLSPSRRKALMNLVNTLLWLGLATFFLKGDDDDEKDTYLHYRTKRLVEDLSMGLNPVDVFHAIEKPITAVSVSAKFGESFVNYLSGATTQEGVRRGLKGIENALPGVGSIRQLQRIASEEKFTNETLFGILPVQEGRDR